MRRHVVKAAAGLAAVMLAATACGGGGSENEGGGSTSAPQTDESQPGDASTSFMVASSTKSFDDTVGALKKSVSKAGMMVMGQLNQAKALSMTGLKLDGAQTFFVGNATTGKKFFEADPAIGAVVPLRVYVWATDDGTNIGYFDPAPVFEAVNPDLADGGKKISGMAKKIAEGAAGAAPAEESSVSATFRTVSSDASFDDTSAALKKSVSKAGMSVLGELDQAKALSVTGLQLEGAHTYFVGNPTIGKKFFEAEPGIGAVVPFRMYVWADEGGTAKIGYLDPAPLFEGVDPKLADGGKQTAQAAEKIVDGATGAA